MYFGSSYYVFLSFVVMRRWVNILFWVLAMLSPAGYRAPARHILASESLQKVALKIIKIHKIA